MSRRLLTSSTGYKIMDTIKYTQLKPELVHPILLRSLKQTNCAHVQRNLLRIWTDTSSLCSYSFSEPF